LAKNTKKIQIRVSAKGARQTAVSLKKVDKSIAGISTSALATTAAIGATVFALKRLGDAAIHLAKLGAQAVNVQRAFLRMTEGTTVNIERLREAAGGAISDLELMQKTVQAKFLIGDIEKLPELLEIARGTAQATGESVEFMFNSIVLGIGRQSRLILDNLGILVNAKEANEAYAESLNKTVIELTDAERRQAFFNAAVLAGKRNIEEAGFAADDNLTKILSAGAAWDNLAIAFGKIVDSPVLLSTFFRAIHLSLTHRSQPHCPPSKRTTSFLKLYF